jgi:hypothetical protein
MASAVVNGMALAIGIAGRQGSTQDESIYQCDMLASIIREF